jgi:hypothetical protein
VKTTRRYEAPGRRFKRFQQRSIRPPHVAAALLVAILALLPFLAAKSLLVDFALLALHALAGLRPIHRLAILQVVSSIALHVSVAFHGLPPFAKRCKLDLSKAHELKVP